MASIGKVVGVAALAVVAIGAMIGGKWFHTAAMEEIHPTRGVYGMDGMEIWIDINARMPAFAREWGCNTLREREKAVLGGKNSMAPYSCQPGFGEGPDLAAYDSIAKVNLDQATAGMDTERAAAVRACFDAKMAAAVTPEDMAALNESSEGEAALKVILAVNVVARGCKAEVGG